MFDITVIIEAVFALLAAVITAIGDHDLPAG